MNNVSYYDKYSIFTNHLNLFFNTQIDNAKV